MPGVILANFHYVGNDVSFILAEFIIMSIPPTINSKCIIFTHSKISHCPDVSRSPPGARATLSRMFLRPQSIHPAIAFVENIRSKTERQSSHKRRRDAADE